MDQKSPIPGRLEETIENAKKMADEKIRVLAIEQAATEATPAYTGRKSSRLQQVESENTGASAKILQQMMGESDPKRTGYAPPVETRFGTTEGVEDICKVSLTPLLKQIFGDRPVEEWMQETGQAARMIYDLTKGAAPQCIAAGKTVEPGVTPCWLCGMPFPAVGAEVPQLEPICDHVLPVAQGTFFLELYSASKIRSKPLDPTIPRPSPLDKVFTLEYEWAHSICNNVKVHAMFMKEINAGGNPKWAPDTVSIRKLLTGIWGRDNQAATAIKSYAVGEYLRLNPVYKRTPVDNPELQKNAKDLWFQKQERSISERILEITNFINDDKFGNLRKLAGWASCVDPKNVKGSFLETVSKIAKNNEPSEQPPAKRMRAAGTMRHKKRIMHTRRRKH